MYSSRIVVGCLTVGALMGASPRALAHIRLSDPIARYEITGADTGIKGCPCGMATGGGNSNRTCNVELDGSDPARNEERASTFPAGSTITLKFEEYVGHTGRYRVAFDPDGADFEDFNANVIHDETDPAGSDGNIGDGTKWEIEVTLPDTPCDNCTLQLLQVMAGGAENPVDASQLATLSTYYTCIDLTLTAPEGDTTDEGTESTSSDPASTDASTSEVNTSDETFASEDETTSGRETTTDQTSTEPSAQTSNDATTTSPQATTSTEAEPTHTPSSVTPAPTNGATTTTNASPTSTGNTTGADTSIDLEEDDGGGEEEAGCSVATARAPSPLLFSLGVAAFGALFVRRRRAA